MKNYIVYCISTLALSLTGCAVGPKYHTPSVSVPSVWSDGKTTSIATKEEAWWRNFHDPLLNELIEQQSVFNLNLQTAQARIKTARADLAMAKAQFAPIVGITALPPSGTGVALTQLIALTTSIQPDIFGRLRQNKQSAKANLEATEADQNFAMINLHAEIATSYLELRQSQAKEIILHNNIGRNSQLLKFIKSRYKQGYDNYINVAQQDSLIETQLAELAQNKGYSTAIIHKIEILTGNNPGLLANKLAPIKPVPQMNQKINLGMPSELLRRRPDIIAAERRVAATHANIRVAIASLFPQISIGWLLGWQSQTIMNNIAAVRNPESTFFGTFNGSLFDLSSYRNIDLKKQEKLVAILQYQIAILSALHDVETQVNFCKYSQLSVNHLKRALDQKQLVLKLSKDTYMKGATDFNTVLRSEEELNMLEMSYLNYRVAHQIAIINLYKALGGNIVNPEGKSK